MNHATLYFRKYFTKGLLKGLTGPVESVTFPTVEDCIAWRDIVSDRSARGKLNYRIADSSFQNFAR